MNTELGFSYETLTNSYAVGSAALCFGVILFMPVAIKFGRRPSYIISTTLQIAISVWASRIQNVADLMLINAFNCFFGSLAEAIVQMTVADIFFIHQRGVMTSIYVWVVIVANSLAPVAAGYVTAGQGWRWVWIWVSILLGICLVLFFFFYEETKFTPLVEGAAPVSLPDPNRKSRILSGRDEEKNVGSLSAQDRDTLAQSASFCVLPRASYIQRLKLWSSSPESFTTSISHAGRPFVVICTIPAVAYAALIYGIVTACYQVSVTVIAAYMVLPPFNFTSDQIGLMSGIPGFIGTSLGTLLSGFFSDKIILWLAKRNGGVYEPEMRLWLLLAFGIFVPVGLLLFGYGLSQEKPWPVVAAGVGIFFTFGMTPASGMVLAYITDAYTNVISDAMVGVVFVRNAFATIFVVALTPWIDAAGIANVFLTLSLVAIVSIILGIGLLIYGKKIRMTTTKKYEAWSAKQCGLRD
ncbi:unnamed protein product [Penicillium pancosmium]